jgi:hypothetical protein
MENKKGNKSFLISIKFSTTPIRRGLKRESLPQIVHLVQLKERISKAFYLSL